MSTLNTLEMPSVMKRRLDVFDSNIPRHGNGVYFSVNDRHPNVRFNNIVKMIYVPANWAIRIWFNDRTKNEQWELEWMMNFLIAYNDVTPYISHIIAAFIEEFAPHLDKDNLDATTWTAEVYVRRLTVREMDEYADMGVEFEGERETTSYDLYLHECDDQEPTFDLIPEKPDYQEAVKARHTGRRFRT